MGLIQSGGQIQIQCKQDQGLKPTTQGVVEGVKVDVITLQAIRSLVWEAGEMAQHLKSIYCPCTRRVLFLVLLTSSSLSSVPPGPGFLLLASLGIRRSPREHTYLQSKHSYT